eukprot:9482509-Ditylum_brightwellii.AAC.1
MIELYIIYTISIEDINVGRITKKCGAYGKETYDLRCIVIDLNLMVVHYDGNLGRVSFNDVEEADINADIVKIESITLDDEQDGATSFAAAKHARKQSETSSCSYASPTSKNVYSGRVKAY